MANGSGDELPIATRKKRRSSAAFNMTMNERLLAKAAQSHGVETPPQSPMTKKRRVRFSEPGPSISTSLTPTVKRSSLASKSPKTKKPNRRHSAPVSSWNLNFNKESPISGTQQFIPLRQVLDGRVKRRLRRNGLSEELNKIQSERRTKEKARLAELERLRAELRNKDTEMQHMRDEWDLRSQFGEEVGNSQSSQLNDKVRDLEAEISALRSRLSQRETEPSVTNETDWTFAARDPFHDYDDDDDHNNEPLPTYDDDFDDAMNMNDVMTSTPSRQNFPSPPTTLPNTPILPNEQFQSSQPLTVASTQADFSDPEKEDMERQLASLQANLSKLSAALEQKNEYESRLSSKLSKFMSSEESGSEATSLDAALDTVLTRLALSQSSVTETSATLDALRKEIGKLGFSPESPADQVITLIASQFRQARLDLEYLNPGELAIGFENQTLLNLLVDRVKTLLGQVKEKDTEIQQSHETERSLREQLAAQVEGLEIVQKDLATTKDELKGVSEELAWQVSSNEKLKKALEGYREEVAGLEALVGRMENDHNEVESQLRSELESAIERADGFETDVKTLEKEREASQKAAEEKDALLAEFKTKLDAMLTAIDTLKSEMKTVVATKDAEIARLTEAKDRELEALRTLVNQRQDEREEDYLQDLATKDERVVEMEAEYEGLRRTLGAANEMIDILENQKRKLETKLRDERGRANGVVMVMREQLKNALNVGLGFLEHSDNEDEDGINDAEEADTTTRPGKFLDGRFARRRSSGGAPVLPMKMKGKRRKYDSGLGFLDEEEGGHGDEETGHHWMSETDEHLEM